MFQNSEKNDVSHTGDWIIELVEDSNKSELTSQTKLIELFYISAWLPRGGGFMPT